MDNINTISVVYLWFTIIIFYLFYRKGKKKYQAITKALDPKDFHVRDFMPAGFALMEMTGYKYNTQFDRVLRKQLKELFDTKYTEFYLRVYWAESVTYTLLALLLSGLFSLSGQIAISVGMVVIGVVMIYVNLTGLGTKVEERHRLITMDMPDLTNKIVILTGAGMTLRQALFKISQDLKTGRPLYAELNKTMKMMEKGETAEASFDHFMTRCNMPEVRRFVSILLLNMQRGGSDISRALSEIGKEQWAARTNAAKRYAEEASTKLLFPMMLMLFSVILLTVAPAVLSMQL